MPKTTTKPKPAPQSLRDVLSHKRRRSTTYVIEVTDPSEAQRALADAEGRHRFVAAINAPDSEQVKASQAAIDEAQAALDACEQRIVLTAVCAQRFIELMKEHPRTKEQKRDGFDWDPDTFQPALIAACAGDELTVEEWTEELDSDRWATGERNVLFNMALELNVGTPERYATAKRMGLFPV